MKGWTSKIFIYFNSFKHNIWKTIQTYFLHPLQTVFSFQEHMWKVWSHFLKKGLLVELSLLINEVLWMNEIQMWFSCTLPKTSCSGCRIQTEWSQPAAAAAGNTGVQIHLRQLLTSSLFIGAKSSTHGLGRPYWTIAHLIRHHRNHEALGVLSSPYTGLKIYFRGFLIFFQDFLNADRDCRGCFHDNWPFSPHSYSFISPYSFQQVWTCVAKQA